MTPLEEKKTENCSSRAAIETLLDRGQCPKGEDREVEPEQGMKEKTQGRSEGVRRRIRSHVYRIGTKVISTSR